MWLGPQIGKSIDKRGEGGPYTTTVSCLAARVMPV